MRQLILYLILFISSSISAQTLEEKISDKLCDCFKTLDHSQEGGVVLTRFKEDCFIQTLKSFEAELTGIVDTVQGDTEYERGLKFGRLMSSRTQVLMIERCDQFFDFMNSFRNGVFKTIKEDEERLNIKDKSKAINDSRLPSDYYSRAVSYFMLRDFKLAKKDLNKAIQLDKSFPAPYLLRGFLFEQTKRYKKAIADYDVSNKLMSRDDIDIYIAIAKRKAREHR